MVVIIARWVLVLAGLVLILLDTVSVSLNVIKFEIAVILALAVSNFFLVAQVLAKRKTLDAVVYGLGLADIAVISLIIIAQGGFESNVYTFYFPAILAFSVAFPSAVLYLFLGGVVGIYGMISLASLFSDGNVGDMQVLVIRLLMLVAVGVCGNYFARVESNRRRAAAQSRWVAARLDEESALPPTVQQTL
jgi:hypothetical protein